MLRLHMLLGLISYAFLGYGSALMGRRPNDTAIEGPIGSNSTPSLMRRDSLIPRRSSSQQNDPINTTSTQAFSSQPSPSALPASVPPTVACWATPYCDSILVDFAFCYNLTGTLKNPNGDDGRSEVYQRCLCNDRGTMYKK
jgi:hypothetical protein